LIERSSSETMISYPGDILCRFGRYEAVEDLGTSGRAHLWGAWDPYLDRFVVIVELGGIDPAQLLHGMRNVTAAIEHWTARKLGAGDLILDFSPGTDGTTAFVVVATTEEEDDSADSLTAGDIDGREEAATAPDPPAARRRRPASKRRQR
jgi:hypothetical protein